MRSATFAVLESPSTVRVAATSVNVTTPEPSVTRACPEVPSVVGRVYAPENST